MDVSSLAAKKYFLDLTTCIQDSDLQHILQLAIKQIPDYFYIVPSSSTGKYHPKDEFIQGGLLIHTARCVKVAEELIRMYDLSNFEADLVKTACILHDCCKNGYYANSGHTLHTHPLLAEALITRSCTNEPRRIRALAKKIAKLVRSHSGRWCTSTSSTVILPTPKTKLEKIVHECDYIASRQTFNIEASLFNEQ